MLNKEEINEGTELIVRFLGWQYHLSDNHNFPDGTWHDGHVGHCAKRGLRFHESWDWLFPVITKINGLGKEYSFAIFKTYVSLTVEKGGKFYKDFSFAFSEYVTSEQTTLEAAFKMVVRYIKWHEENILTKVENNEK